MYNATTSYCQAELKLFRLKQYAESHFGKHKRGIIFKKRIPPQVRYTISARECAG
jgi:hypothetical protein